MGISGLETFIRNNPRDNISVEIDIRDEIAKWQQ